MHVTLGNNFRFFRMSTSGVTHLDKERLDTICMLTIVTTSDSDVITAGQYTLCDCTDVRSGHRIEIEVVEGVDLFSFVHIFL